MRVLVCGGRNFRSPAQVNIAMDAMHVVYKFTALMQGGATGVDQFAKEWATKHPEIQRYVCRAEWDKYGAAAGPKRNARMLEWHPDLVVAFPGGNGTADMVLRAERAGLKIVYIEVRENGNESLAN